MAATFLLFLNSRESGSVVLARVALLPGLPCQWAGRCVASRSCPRIGVGIVVLAVLALLGQEALAADPGMDQDAIHREVVFAEEFAFVRQGNYFGEEVLHHPMLQQPAAVRGEAGVVRGLAVDGQANEPAVQQVAPDLLDQLALATHTEEHLDDHGAQQFLGGYGGPACVRVDRVEQAVQADQCFVDQAADRARAYAAA